MVYMNGNFFFNIRKDFIDKRIRLHLNEFFDRRRRRRRRKFFVD